jgi:hypothetical protein
VRDAIMIYMGQFGEPPKGENLEIAAALRGSNSTHVDFLPGREAWFDKSGRLIDTWGTALEITIVSNNTIVDLRSAGPNKKLGDKDDLYYRLPMR